MKNSPLIVQQKKIVWLASYPKSGNTWFRVFLSNLTHPKNSPALINELEGAPIASSRLLFDEATGLSSADLTSDEIDNLRPDVYRYINEQTEGVLFHKIHDAFTLNAMGAPIVPADITRGALYFIRNPLDVAVSFAYHSVLPFTKIIKQMNNNQFAFCSQSDKLHNQLNQKLLTWSNHVKSWTEQTNFPVMVIRFEDMKNDTFATFKKAVEFAQLRFSDDEIEKAIRFSDFKIIKQQEEEFGFREKTQESKSFFRKGIIGSWKEELSPAEIETITEQHSEVMKKYGYI